MGVNRLIEQEQYIWVFRNRDGSLCGSINRPHRNETWGIWENERSGTKADSIFAMERVLFEDLLWTDDPVRAKISIERV